ncbi:AraC family transcriptional regulator [Chryseolinea lacunae]|uniref:Helix-turn-helix domain-containing protein n=1 Tax=Chryseolinea lacunae TaxID=2801331 RepID=A0ABS1KR85_9BACT|nr:AraC family transcriptional regulator [Chryseolinea lacunae]MBL0741954.1 helix-turn-helix domain-containing protein [Chryseolinea lacunae]
MVKDNLYEPFQIVLKEVMDKCPRLEHAHSFFELVYIVSGTGKQVINKTKVDYRAAHLFLLTPEDSHVFEFETPTQLLFIRFTKSYLGTNGQAHETLNRLDNILRNARHEPGCILHLHADRNVVKAIMEAIVQEHEQHGLYHEDLLRHYVNTLLVIVARNISQRWPDAIHEGSDEKAVDILHYIQSHIHEPDKLKADIIGAHFGISETYLGRYFKKHSNETLQQYITNYKLTLVENRLLHTNMRIGEIADELGFTDKSHLNRIFKKHRGMNPSAFKKEKS